MGPSGSGKTTFINILMGLIQPTHGSIKVDGIDITNGIESWQKFNFLCTSKRKNS